MHCVRCIRIHRRTEGYSSAEIIRLCQQAVTSAASRQQHHKPHNPRIAPAATKGVCPADFEHAFAAVGKPGLGHKEAMHFLKWKLHVAEL